MGSYSPNLRLTVDFYYLTGAYAGGGIYTFMGTYEVLGFKPSRYDASWGVQHPKANLAFTHSPTAA